MGLFHPPTSALTNAAETRRREMPASIALIILTGGLAAAIMGGAAPVGWAAIMSLLLIFDTEIYRRLDAADAQLDTRAVALLAGWSFASSLFYAVLPMALWLHGESAGAAAAMVLWVAGVVRHFSPGASGAWQIALAGAAPPALSLLGSPLLLAAMTRQPDWDLAAIAAVGGGALMAYVTQARMSAAEAEAALRRGVAEQDLQRELGALMLSDDRARVALVNTDGAVVAASRGVAVALGRDLMGGIAFEDVAPIARDRWRVAFARALAGETTIHVEEELELRTGRAWFDWESRPWRDERGVVRGVAVVGRDVTSLVAARKVAAGNHDLLRMALEAGHSVVWEVDYKLRTICWYGDARAIYGDEPFTFEQFDANTTRIIHEDDRDMLAAYFRNVAAGGGGSVEHRVLRPDGSISWAQIRAQRVFGRSGGVRKLVVLAFDVTDRKRGEAAFISAMHRAEAALKAKRALFGEDAPDLEAIDEAAVGVDEMFERLDALIGEMDARDEVLGEMIVSLRSAREAAEAASLEKSQFLTSMSHELRTPLNAIIGYAEILQEDAEADGRDSDLSDIDRILTAARQLLHLINDILDISKIEAGRMDVLAADFSVAALVNEAVATVRPSAEKNGNVLQLEVAPDVGEAHSDSFKLTQCLLNLLSNAAKFTTKGEVCVRARRLRREAGDWIEIAVADTGIGMTEEQSARVFGAYQQADASTARRFGGTGLGLAITRRIMQLLGGDVSVSSRYGQGSTFTLMLPARAGEAVAPARIDAAAAASEGAQRTVLMIDDDENARDLVGRSLARLGFVVRAARTGAEGIALSRTTRPSLVILDINLPDISGWDVLSVLAATPETATVPVVVHSIEDNRQRALGMGACELLAKPADRDAIAATALRFARGGQDSKPAVSPSVIATMVKTA